MALTINAKRIALLLILFFTALGVTLAHATTEDNYKNDTHLLTRIFESTYKENGFKTTIIINPHTTGIYAKENGFNLDLTINPKGIGGSHTENNYQLDLIPEKTFPDISDLAVANVTPSKTVVGQGLSCKINATVSNKGLYYETFHVTIYANTTTLKTLTITLTSKDYTTIAFTWNTTGFAYGNYTITAYATPVPGETATADNTLVDGIVFVTVPGDIDGNGYVNFDDFVIFSGKYGSQKGDGVYDERCDLKPDGKVDFDDFVIFSGKYGQSIYD